MRKAVPRACVVSGLASIYYKQEMRNENFHFKWFAFDVFLDARRKFIKQTSEILNDSVFSTRFINVFLYYAVGAHIPTGDFKQHNYHLSSVTALT